MRPVFNTDLLSCFFAEGVRQYQPNLPRLLLSTLGEIVLETFFRKKVAKQTPRKIGLFRPFFYSAAGGRDDGGRSARRLGLPR